MVNKFKKFIKRTIFRNIVTLGSGQKKFGSGIANIRCINLEFFKNLVNLGDFLPKIVYDWMIIYYKLDKNKKVKRTIHLMTIGSIIGMGYFDAVIWGSGIHMNKTVRNLIEGRKKIKYDIRAVRGPVTRAFLRGAGYDCPEVYGDPAVLMPNIYDPRENKNQQKKYKISFIAHWSMKDKYNLDKYKDIHFIDICTHDYKKVIDEIVMSEKSFPLLFTALSWLKRMAFPPSF